MSAARLVLTLAPLAALRLPSVTQEGSDPGASQDAAPRRVPVALRCAYATKWQNPFDPSNRATIEAALDIMKPPFQAPHYIPAVALPKSKLASVPFTKFQAPPLSLPTDPARATMAPISGVLMQDNPPSTQKDVTDGLRLMGSSVGLSLVQLALLRNLDVTIRKASLDIKTPTRATHGMGHAAAGTLTSSFLRIVAEQFFKDASKEERSLVFAMISVIVHPFRIADMSKFTKENPGKMFPSAPLTVFRDAVFRYLQLSIQQALENYSPQPPSLTIDYLNTVISTGCATILSSGLAFSALCTTAGKKVEFNSAVYTKYLNSLPPSIARMVIMMSVLWISTHQDELASKVKGDPPDK